MSKLSLVMCVNLVLFFSHILPAYSFDKCLREFPAHTGAWSDNEPPYWKLSGCKNQVFDMNQTIQCMQGRTFYVIGISTARQFAFQLVEMLGGANVPRLEQKELCPKQDNTWGSSCHNEFAGVKIRYLFMHYMDGFNYSRKFISSLYEFIPIFPTLT